MADREGLLGPSKAHCRQKELLFSSVVGNTVCGCWGYIVNGVTGGDEVGDVTGDDVW